MSYKRKKIPLGMEETFSLSYPKRSRTSSVVVRRRDQPAKALKVKKPENKFFDTLRAATEFNYDSTFAEALNLVVQGDTVNNRDGNKIKVTGVEIRGMISPSGIAAIVTQGRILVVYDKRPNLGGLAPMSDILISTPGATDVYRLRNRATGKTDRFRVLKDFTFNTTEVPFNTAAGSGGNLMFHWFLPIQALCEYGANAGAAADLQVGLITVYATSTVAVASTGPTLEYQARVSFEEI